MNFYGNVEQDSLPKPILMCFLLKIDEHCSLFCNFIWRDLMVVVKVPSFGEQYVTQRLSMSC